MVALAPRPAHADGRPTIVGFSGGLDSTVLLHLLAASAAADGTGLRAIHVHHGLHPQADDWAEHCRHVCVGIDVPLAIVHVDVGHGGGEGAARKARHAAFATELRDGEILALAHHRDDQAETFLLRALRASGPDGLGAMRGWQQFGRGWLWRPLLGCPRSGLLAHATHHRLQWVEDPSNSDTSIDRNFLRHRVLPLLRERWPHADTALARSAALSGEASELLAGEDACALRAARSLDPRTIHVDTLRQLPVARRARVLRRWISSLDLPPMPAQGITRIEADLFGADADSDAQFAWSGVVVRRWRNLLHVELQRAPWPTDWQANWDGRAPLALPGGGSLRLMGAEGFDGPLRVHARQGGERIRLPGRKHSHSLKHVLQDLDVAPWMRQRLPLLYTADGTLLAAGDRIVSASFDAWLRSHGAALLLDAGDD